MPPAADAAAAAPIEPAAPPAAGPSEKERKKFVEAASRKDYVAIMKAVHEGMSPNVDWKGLLPLRTAVLVGDVDMVALLFTIGAQPLQEPKTTVEAKDGEPERVVTLGKSAFALAEEISKDFANPLQREAVHMLELMRNPQTARERVGELHKKVEAQINSEMRQSGMMLALFITLFIGSFVALRYLGVNEDGGDEKEL